MYDSESEKKDTRTTLRLPADIKDMLTVEAERQNRSVHNLILTILRDYFRKDSD